MENLSNDRVVQHGKIHRRSGAPDRRKALKIPDFGIMLEVNEELLHAAAGAEVAASSVGSFCPRKGLHVVDKEIMQANGPKSYLCRHGCRVGSKLFNYSRQRVSEVARNLLDLIMATQEVVACTIQLEVVSHVKVLHGTYSEPGGTRRLEDLQDLDLGSLTQWAKEIDIQVRVLELEQPLQSERM